MGQIMPTGVEPSPAELSQEPSKFGKSVLKRLDMAIKTRDLYNDLFIDAYDYGFPSRPNFNKTNEGERRTDMLFDDTLPNSIPEFASELQSGLVPVNGDIMKLVVGPTVPADKRFAMQKELDELNDFVHSKLRASNFADETHEAFQDLAVGTANLMMDSVGVLGDFNFTAVPIHECYLDSGPDGKPDGRYKIHKVKRCNIMAKWRKAKLSLEMQRREKENPDEKIDIIEGIWRNWKNSSKEEYEYFVVVKATGEVLVKETTSGQGSCPWITARWSVNSGEVWGRGPVLNIMPTVKSTNLVLQLIFENAQIAIGGIWQYDSDGTINPDTIIMEPGTFIPREIGSRIDPLESPSRFDVAQFVIEEARSGIRKGMLVDSLDQQGKTPPSAQQVGYEMGKFARRMGASYNRLQNEYTSQVFKRALWLLKQRGIVNMPEIDGEEIEIIAVSPLARAQNAANITDFTRFLEVSKFALGEEAAGMSIKPQESMQWLAEQTGVDKRLIKTKNELARELQKAQELAQQNPELAGAVTGG